MHVCDDDASAPEAKDERKSSRLKDSLSMYEFLSHNFIYHTKWRSMVQQGSQV